MRPALEAQLARLLGALVDELIQHGADSIENERAVESATVVVDFLRGRVPLRKFGDDG